MKSEKRVIRIRRVLTYDHGEASRVALELAKRRREPVMDAICSSFASKIWKRLDVEKRKLKAIITSLERRS